MAQVLVKVVNRNGTPIAGEKVFLQIHTALLPSTWLEKYTDSNGNAVFDVSDTCTIEVSTRGKVKYKGITGRGILTIGVE